ncbi:MAG: DUF296 domain-containing protein [Candidatus Omnitrophota bacterium]
MEYTQASIGRVFLVAFDHEDDLLNEIKKLFIQERINFGTITFFGALADGKMVTGPRNLCLPATPQWFSFRDGREVLGFGTVVKKGTKVEPHIHFSAGRRDKTTTGCLREHARIFITIEAVVTELTGIDVSREPQKKIGGHKILTSKKSSKKNKK